MGISPEHRPPLRPHCSRSEVALNGSADATDRILLGPVHHLRQLHETNAVYADCSRSSSMRPWARAGISLSPSVKVISGSMDGLHLTHHVDILEMNGDSLRLKHSSRTDSDQAID